MYRFSVKGLKYEFCSQDEKLIVMSCVWMKIGKKELKLALSSLHPYGSWPVGWRAIFVRKAFL